jgi:hypothetical protein
MWDEEPERSPEAGEPIPFRPSDVVPVGASEIELVADIWSADAHLSREHALRAAAVTALARRRRAERDAAFGPRGGPGPDSRSLRSAVLDDVSEDFVTELALIRQCSEAEASAVAVESLLLTEKLTGTWSELHAGRIDPRKARAMVDLLGDVTDQIAAAVEARVLSGAETLTGTAFRDRVRYHLDRLDEEARNRRRREAVKKADVHVWPAGDGMSQFVVDLPTPDALTCRDAVDQYARFMRADGDPRPIGVLRAAAATDLLLRPWDTSRPPVTANLTIHAQLPALRPDAGPGEVITVATRAELRRAAGSTRRRRIRRDGAPAPPDGSPPTPDAADGPGLRPPPPTSAYRPTAAQRRLIQTRDRHCRMPGCRRRPGRCDIDHSHTWADGGPTDCWNLASRSTTSSGATPRFARVGPSGRRGRARAACA